MAKKNAWNSFWKNVGKASTKIVKGILDIDPRTDKPGSGGFDDKEISPPTITVPKVTNPTEKLNEDLGLNQTSSGLIAGSLGKTVENFGNVTTDFVKGAAKGVEEVLGAPTDAAIAALEDQKTLNAEKLKIDEERAAALLDLSIGQKTLQFNEDAKAASLVADEYTAKAGQTQKIADQERIAGNMSVTSALGKAATQSIQDNRQASLLDVQSMRDQSTIQARSGASGVKQSGSSAVYITQSQKAANEAKKNNINAIKSSISDTLSGTMSAKQQMDANYQSALFDKNAMLEKASQIRNSYTAGGQAYNLYTGNIDAMRKGATADSLANTKYVDINNNLLTKEQKRFKDNKNYQMLSTGFQFASQAVSFASSAISLIP